MFLVINRNRIWNSRNQGFMTQTTNVKNAGLIFDKAQWTVTKLTAPLSIPVEYSMLFQ